MQFEYLYMDKVCSVVTVEGDKITVVNYTDDILMTAFGNNKNITLDDLEEFFEERCFPRSRAKQVLKNEDIPYVPYLIIQRTHGTMFDDCFWIRFEGEDLCWDDVNPVKKANAIG